MRLREFVRKVFRVYLRDMVILLFVFLSIFYFYASGLRVYGYFLIEDIIKAVIDAINQFASSMAPDPNVVFQQVLNALFYAFVNQWDLEIAVVGFLIGIITGGDFGETFLSFLSTVLWYIRLAKFQLSMAEWLIIISAVNVELIPLVDISMLPIVIPLLTAKQTFFAQLGFLFGAMLSKMFAFNRATGIWSWLARIVALFGLLVIISHMLLF